MVAKKLSAVPKRPADLCARYGGEEFTLLLPNTNLRQAEKLAEKCREKIFQLNIPHKSSSVGDVVTISAGVASMVPAKGTTDASLIKAADEAMYLAKENGRNTVISS